MKLLLQANQVLKFNPHCFTIYTLYTLYLTPCFALNFNAHILVENDTLTLAQYIYVKSTKLNYKQTLIVLKKSYSGKPLTMVMYLLLAKIPFN